MPHTPRRTLLQALGASPLGLVLPAAADQPATQGATRTFVLVHGMFGGGWVWRVVAPMLRRLGHEVHTPTLTGLGERSHLLSAQITIDTHIEDICNVLDTNDLTNVTLVAHSYGGMVATGVADRRRARLRRLIYLDALLPRDGETGFDLLPPGMADLRRRAAATNGGGVAFPVPDASAVPLPADHPMRDWFIAHLRPHPLGTYDTPVRLTAPIGAGLPVAYVAYEGPPAPSIEPSRQRARAQSHWTHDTLPVPHDAEIANPDQVVSVLTRYG